jgi:hypothetical protein
MKQFRSRMAESRFVTWAVPVGVLPISWDEALRRLEKPDTVHGQGV